MDTGRYLAWHLQNNPEDLEKMVFVAGPRQVGKTTLLEGLAHHFNNHPQELTFLNWDRKEDKRIIRKSNLNFFKDIVANASPTRKPIVLFDEIHKYRQWKTFLKGYFDTFKNQIVTFVTGSARLAVYRRGGDSMLGRYWLYQLHPFTLGETIKHFCPPPFEKLPLEKTDDAVWKKYLRLYEFGGFPEPYLKGSSTHHRRWLRMRRERLLKEDLRDLSRIHDLSDVEQMMQHIREGVGSPFSLNSIREKMDVSHNAVRNWVGWLESIYYCFRISPYSKKIERSLKKEGKYYLYDWSELDDEGARFENMTAIHLKKSVDFWNDAGVGDYQLYYVRDLEKREVDFLITQNDKPWLLAEAKKGVPEIPPSFVAMAEKLNPTHSLVVTHTRQAGRFQTVKNIKIWTGEAASFFALLV